MRMNGTGFTRPTRGHQIYMLIPEVIIKKNGYQWGDWLGTGTVAPQKKQFMQFEEAREFVRSLHLKSTDEWDEYCKSGKKPDDIPGYPYGYTKNNGLTGLIGWVTKYRSLVFKESKGTIRRID